MQAILFKLKHKTFRVVFCNISKSCLHKKKKKKWRAYTLYLKGIVRETMIDGHV